MANEAEIIALVKLKSEAQDKNKRTFWKIDLVEHGQDNAHTWSLFDDMSKVPDIGIGQHWRFSVTQEPGDRGTYRNIKKVLGRVDAQEAETPQAKAAETVPAVQQGRDVTGRSIEKQVALKEAVLWHKDVTDSTPFDVLDTANWFAFWLRNPRQCMAHIEAKGRDPQTGSPVDQIDPSDSC